jgi:hypothetical protein
MYSLIGTVKLNGLDPWNVVVQLPSLRLAA